MISTVLLTTSLAQQRFEQRPLLIDEKAHVAFMKIYNVAKESPYVDADFPQIPKLGIDWQLLGLMETRHPYCVATWNGMESVLVDFHQDGMTSRIIAKPGGANKLNFSLAECIDLAKAYYFVLGGEHQLKLKYSDAWNNRPTYKFQFQVVNDSGEEVGFFKAEIERKYGFPNISQKEILEKQKES